MKKNKQSIGFGDNVKIRPTRETEKIGLAGFTGQVYGETTPSITAVEVIGELTEDFAINVHIEEKNEAFWFSEDQLEFLNHGAGTEITVGNIKAVRKEDGSWNETVINQNKKPWWKIW